MALRDSFSPQNALSPSVQSSQTTSINLKMDLLENQYRYDTINSLTAAAAFSGYIAPHQLDNLKQINQHKLILNEYTHSSHIKLQISASNQPKNIQTTAIIKEEENDSIQSDDPEHINVEDRIPPTHFQSNTPSVPISTGLVEPITFSISNILSDRFGKFQEFRENQPKLPFLSSIFRPFEIITKKNNNFAEKSAFTKPTTNTESGMTTKKSALFDCFNSVTYPRIHEEIINSSQKSTQDLKNFVPPSPKANGSSLPTLSNFEETVPHLGSLSKAVSKIGSTLSQSFFINPVPNSNSSIVSTSSSSYTSIFRITNNSPQPFPPLSVSRDSGMESSDDTRSETSSTTKDENGSLWPAWVYCTRYSDRPSSGPRYRRLKQPNEAKTQSDDKRPRTAFSSEQLVRLKREFNENRYLTERRRQQLSSELGLNEAQIKIWFQNKRAKIKKSTGQKNPLALQLMAQGLYNHSTVPLTKEEEELEIQMNRHII